MLFGISRSHIHIEQSQICITLKWKSGLERTFIMPFKANLKAGILLYAMFMASVFAGFTGLPFSSDSSTQGIPSSN